MKLRSEAVTPRRFPAQPFVLLIFVAALQLGTTDLLAQRPELRATRDQPREIGGNHLEVELFGGEFSQVAALVDDEAYLLGEEAIAEGVAIPAGASAEVMVAWTPSASDPLQVLAHLYDAGFRELAKRPDLALHAQSLSLQPAPRAGQQVTVSATVRNLGPGAARQVEVHFRILSPSGQQLARGVERLPRIESRQSAVVRWSLRMPAGNRWRLEVATVTPGDLDTGNDRAATTLSAPPTRLVRPRARPN